MADRRARIFILGLYMFFLSLNLPGQTGSYYLDRQGDDIRFIQRLDWEKEEYAYRYEAVVEQEDEGIYQEILREFTDEPFMEFSIPPGKYRYGVRVYDLLDRPGEMSEWVFFEIILAREPELRELSPGSFYLDEDTSWVLTIAGGDLEEGAEVYLRHPDSGRRAIVPQEFSVLPGGNGIRLVFDQQQLVPGSYEVYIKNPGGLDTDLAGFNIAFRKPMDIYTKAAYGPLIPLYGDLNRYFDQPVFPLGGGMRLNVIPYKRMFGYIGTEFMVNWQYFYSRFTGYEVAAHETEVSIHLLYQKWFSNRIIALNFRAGGGLSLLADFHFIYPRGNSPSAYILSPQVGGGFSLTWLIRKPFALEFGLEYLHLFVPDEVPLGYLRPWLGAGWQF